MTETIRFVVPLPPVMIRSNSRSHWARRVKAKQEYSEAVLAALANQTAMQVLGRPATLLGVAMVMGIVPEGMERKGPWAKARVTFTWKACHLPDQSNVLGNCKALLDILCMAPKTAQTNNTTYLGLIEDDKGVIATGAVEKVSHRHEECVVVVIERVK